VDLFGKKAFLTDTVGFIDRLPISLIEAFHSTLEETIFSDLILLVLDVSEPEDVIQRKLTTSLDTIEKIGAMGVPMITVLNKMDLLSRQEVGRRVELLKSEGQSPVPISALYKTNIDALKTELKRFMKQYIQTSFVVPVNHNSLSFLSWLFAHAAVQKVDYGGHDMKVTFQAVPEFAEQVKGQIRKFGGKFATVD
jgi:GTP-binding protein HflX